MKKTLFLFSLFSIMSSLIFAQAKNNITLSGYVKDIASGETLPGATVAIPNLKIGTRTNNYGFYSLSLPAGSSIELKINYLGFESKTIQLNISENKTLNIDLESKSIKSKEVIITSQKKDKNVKSAEMGTHQLAIEDIKKLPVIMGEVDILKSLQLLPGVSSAGEGQSGFYVRGGGPDQNLILLDDAVVYNTGHLFGFFSVFNADAIKNVTLIKGGMPANFGGRLSSVVDVVMKDGNNKNYQLDGGIGLIASRLSIQGPIIKDKSSFMISGRRTYIDALVKPFVKKTSTFKGSGYYFYDLNAKANYTFSNKDRLFLSGYFGKDIFTFNSPQGNFNAKIPWGNATGTVRWNHLFSNRLFLNTTLLYNDYKFEFTGGQKEFNVTFFSGIKDWSGKLDFDYATKNNHNIKFGTNYTYHRFTPSTVKGEINGEPFNPDQASKKYAHELGIYALDEFDLGKKIKINAGLRYSRFIQSGPYTRYEFDPITKIKKDSIVYQNGENVKTYGGFEPRLNARLSISENSSIKASVARTYQYLHLVTNNGSTLPTDIWTPSSYFVRPQNAWQYSLGSFNNFFDNKLETSVEVYYKKMNNMVEYREGYIPGGITDIDYDFVFGTGDAYGAEFYINKTKGKFTGWVSYTLAWTKRNFPQLNKGETYFAKYDQRHNLSVTSSYEINNKWSLSAVFIYGSGTRVTLPSELYIINGQLLQNYDKLNNYRIPAYHRFDIAATYTPKPKKEKRWQGSWNFGIYNVYSRQNPYFLYLDLPGNVATSGVEIKVKQVSVFPIIPSITYNFKFK